MCAGAQATGSSPRGGKGKTFFFCCSLRGDLDASVFASAKATGSARRGGKGKTFFFCCSPLRGDLDARVCAGAQATGLARRGGKGKTFFFRCSPLGGNLGARVCAGAQAAIPDRRGGKVKTFFFAVLPYMEICKPEFAQAQRQLVQLAEEGKVRRSFSFTWRSGRQSLHKSTGNWLSSQRRER